MAPAGQQQQEQQQGQQQVDMDLTGATISERGPVDERTSGRGMHQAPSIELPNVAPQCVSHIALDLGGSLIKLVYFSPDSDDHQEAEAAGAAAAAAPGSSQDAAAQGPGTAAAAAAGQAPQVSRTSTSSAGAVSSGRGGRLHFVKFETAHVEEAIAFIEAKGLHRVHLPGGSAGNMRIKATGGGAFRYADMFRERLGVVLEKEDEMICLVTGCNFLLKAITHEAFTYENGATHFVPTDGEASLYPYLLVNIGSGVSMVKVTGEGQFERVSGSSLGGGTFWGLCHLLTGLTNFDDMLERSMQGDNSQVDMLVGDIYGGRDYSNIGLSASTIASSFGKVITQDKSLPDYKAADMSMALCRMISYNIGQLAYLNAMRYDIKRIFFGGFFIRGHPYTMETISYAIRFWSKGDMAAMFLRHEGFLGAVGAFLLVQPATAGLSLGSESSAQPSKVRAKFVERFSMGAPLTGGQVVGPAIGDLQGKITWVEKFVALGGGLQDSDNPGQAAPSLPAAASPPPPPPPPPPLPLDSTQPAQQEPHGQPVSTTLQTTASCHRQPSLLSRVNTLSDGGMLVPAGSGSLGPHQRGMSLHRPSSTDQPVSPVVRMALHVGVLHYSPGFDVFPLLADPDGYEPNTLSPLHDDELRWWLSLMESQVSTVANKASVSEGNSEAAQRQAAAFGSALRAHLEKLRAEPGAYGAMGLGELFELREECLREFGFHDVYKKDKMRENAAALQVLPDLLAEVDTQAAGAPRWQSLIEGALAANIFDWGANACVALYQAGTILDIYREARARLSKRPWALDDFDMLLQRLTGSHYGRVLMFVDNAGADVVLGQLPIARELLRGGSDVVMVANKLPAINDITATELEEVLEVASTHCAIIRAARQAAKEQLRLTAGRIPPGGGRTSPLALQQASASHGGAASSGADARSSGGKLYVVDSGQGSPCINYRRVSNSLAEAAEGAGLIMIEGMGRAIHTNFKAKFKCDALLLAMIKTERLAKLLFGDSGALYDCVCKFSLAS